MRVGRFNLARLHDEEQGAVLAIAAISLLVLLGMLVLTFDLGRGVAIKRNAVIAADSGALAAAMECGLANGEASAKQAADDLVADNNADAAVTGFELDPAECSGGGSDGENTVTVTVSVPQDYVFAPIFGFDNGTVVASATAEWTMGVANPVPLKLDLPMVDECTNGHPPGYTGSECYFAFEKPGTGSWGWLDFPQGWPTDNNDPARCTSQAGGSNELSEYIKQMGVEGSIGLQAALWNPPPTWVCAFNGKPESLLRDMRAWLLEVADMDPKPMVFFPVAACPVCDDKPVAYPVVDLRGMRIVDVWSGNTNEWPSDAKKNCTFVEKGGQGNKFCIQMEVSSPDDPVLNANPEVRLID